jgi:Holliday junction DNA helicase RuvA
MIEHLQGNWLKTPTQVIIDCGGVGYQVNISLHLFITSLMLILLNYLSSNKEDAHCFGFMEKSEREILKCCYQFQVLEQA